MLEGKIRIKLKSFDAALVDRSAKRIALTAKTSGAEVSGPIPLPTKRTLFSVIRSPHVHKRSQEQFELRVHKRLIEIRKPTQETIDKLSRLDLPAGVDVEIKML
ncbi:MAG: 30S ribosomal protein S10 [Candidatus Hydrothermota bacterium]|nr:30S ribosomal protein S10 [Candidatus Hydrothermae bacterium]RKY99095.1 MAG: 30S ribosomal protein S10 [Candidatus Hydrothermae bacterium]